MEAENLDLYVRDYKSSGNELRAPPETHTLISINVTMLSLSSW